MSVFKKKGVVVMDKVAVDDANVDGKELKVLRMAGADGRVVEVAIPKEGITAFAMHLLEINGEIYVPKKGKKDVMYA